MGSHSLNSNNANHYIMVGMCCSSPNSAASFLKAIKKEALQGCTYILIIQNNASQESLEFSEFIHDLQQRALKPLLKIANNHVLAEGNIYYLPENTGITFKDNGFELAPLQAHNTGYIIDNALESVARIKQQWAMGVLLSGHGHDGCRGLQVIKEQGGRRLVQQLASCEQKSMPEHALELNIGTPSLAPEKMPSYIELLINRDNGGIIHSPVRQAIAKHDLNIKRILQHLKNTFNVDFKHNKASLIAHTLEQDYANFFGSINDYYHQLMHSKPLTDKLYKALLNGDTQFFKDPELYQQLQQHLQKRIANPESPLTELRVWVAGCATGEEAYSLAITIDKACRAQNKALNIKIFATDIDTQALKIASRGVYPKSISRHVPPSDLAAYFIESEHHYHISGHLREKIIFSPHNIIDEPAYSKIDLISCQNVLSLLNRYAQKHVASSLYYAMGSGATLLLGREESLGDYLHHLQALHPSIPIFEKSSNLKARVLPPPKRIRANFKSRVEQLPIAVLQAIHPLSRKHLGLALEKLTHAYAPDSIVLDEQLNITHRYGDTSSYVKNLSAGPISYHIDARLDIDINLAVRAAVQRCIETQEDVRLTDIPFNNPKPDQQAQLLDIQACLIKPAVGENHSSCFLILFLPQSTKISNAKAQGTAHRESHADSIASLRIIELEKALQTLEQEYSPSISALQQEQRDLLTQKQQLADEAQALQESNATTSSVNNELRTVNAECIERIEQLKQTNKDLNAAYQSINVGLIFLDADGLVQHITPTASGYTKNTLHEHANITSQPLLYPQLGGDIQKVLNKSCHKEITTNINGQSFHIILSPIDRSHGVLPQQRKASPHRTPIGVLISISPTAVAIDLTPPTLVLRGAKNALPPAKITMTTPRPQVSVRIPPKKLRTTAASTANTPLTIGVLVLINAPAQRDKINRLLALCKLPGDVFFCEDKAELARHLQPNSICITDVFFSHQWLHELTKKLPKQSSLHILTIASAMLAAQENYNLERININTTFLDSATLNSAIIQHAIDTALTVKIQRQTPEPA